MTPEHQPQRLEILDLARGVGFLIVLFRHCLGFLGGTALVRVMPQDATILDFFFLLSGFFAGYAYQNKLRGGQKTVSRALLERIVRIYPMVILGTLIGALLSLTQYMHYENINDLRMLLSAVLKGSLLIPSHVPALNFKGPLDLFPLDVPLWFLLLDSLGYVLFLFVLRYMTLMQLSVITGLALLGLWNGAIHYNGVSFGTAWVDLPWAIPRALFGFTFGYILFRVRGYLHLTVKPSYALLPVIALVAVVFIPLPATSKYSGELQALIAAIVMPIIVIVGANAKINPRLLPVAQLAARVALPVYALHFPIVKALSNLRWTFHLHGAAGIALLAIEFLLSLAVALLATFYFDEPARAFLLSKASQIGSQQTSSMGRKAS